ncbi:MAG: Ig-like domain-containing protein [Dysgonamonadaceae bacterium]|jgi:uncharacterized protein YjdB|nr:Ig-like domain-containing protein [Dysgonamonadaceae bacterium]
MANIAFTDGMNRREGLVKIDRIMVENSETKAAEWATLGDVESLIGGGGVSVPVTGIVLNSTSYTLSTIGNSFQLLATVSPANATNKGVVWSSTNPSIVSVSQSGLITRLQNSTTAVVITATTADGGFNAYCTIPKNSNATITLGRTGIEVDSTGMTLEGEVYIDVQVNISGLDNKSFNILNIPAWCTATKYNGYFRVSIGTNTTGAFRDGTLVVQSEEDNELVANLHIGQAATAYIEIIESLTSYSGELPEEGGSLKIYANIHGTANRMVDVTTSAGWLTLATWKDGEAYGQGWFTVTASENTGSERTATVQVYPAGKTTGGRTYSITQLSTGEVIEVEYLGINAGMYIFQNTDIGSSLNLAAIITPDNATDKSVEYELINALNETKNTFDVDGNGNVSIARLADSNKPKQNGAGLCMKHIRADGRRLIKGTLLIGKKEVISNIMCLLSQKELEIDNRAQTTTTIMCQAWSNPTGEAYVQGDIGFYQTNFPSWATGGIRNPYGFGFDIEENTTGQDREFYVTIEFSYSNMSQFFNNVFKLIQKA